MDHETLIYLDERFLEHDPGPGHPESPARLAALRRSFEADPPRGTRRVPARPATREQLLRVHAPEYLDLLERLRGRAAQLDGDTALSPRSVESAWLAAGATVDAVTRVCAGEALRAFVFPRPPGHHAERDRAMGFCLLGNVALAAAHAVAALGCERVLIVDWDVHHGNGTQHAFEARRDVLLFDTHQSPLYPGSGDAGETGAGDGRGFTVNVPLPPSCGDGDHAAAFDALLRPVADAFEPDLVLVSAGFDAHRDDPLAQQQLTESGFAALAGVVVEIAEAHAQGRVVAVLEGGYAPRALVASARAVIDVLGGAPPPPILPVPCAGALRAFDDVRRAHRDGWFS